MEKIMIIKVKEIKKDILEIIENDNLKKSETVIRINKIIQELEYILKNLIENTTYENEIESTLSEFEFYKEFYTLLLMISYIKFIEDKKSSLKDLYSKISFLFEKYKQKFLDEMYDVLKYYEWIERKRSEILVKKVIVEYKKIVKKTNTRKEKKLTKIKNIFEKIKNILFEKNKSIFEKIKNIFGKIKNILFEKIKFFMVFLIILFIAFIVYMVSFLPLCCLMFLLFFSAVGFVITLLLKLLK